jgi:germination protein M
MLMQRVSHTVTASLLAGALSMAVAVNHPAAADAPLAVTPAVAAAPSATIASPATGVTRLSAYFLSSFHVRTVHRTVPRTVATGRAAMLQLLAGPSATDRALGLTTSIPARTALRGIGISGGIATVDLSASFGVFAGWDAVLSRLAQVVYTLTQFPTVQGVTFKIEGLPLLGWRGIPLRIIVCSAADCPDHPLTRADFEARTPAVFVEAPAPYDSVGRRIRVYGTANVFEATFMVRLTDARGHVLYQHFQMATSGSGTRGTFDFILTVSTAHHGIGRLRLWATSPEDGSDIDVVVIPIRM